MTVYGYARVSSAGQDLEIQRQALTAAGCERIFEEKASAAQGKARPELAKIWRVLAAGDMLLVKSLTRVARSTRDALAILDAVVARGAVFRSLDEPWADMTTPAGEFMTTLMSAFSQFDRQMILARTAEGRRHAKAKGRKLGPKFKLSAAQQRFVIDSRAAIPPKSFDELAALLKVSVSTLKRVVATAEDAAGAAFPMLNKSDVRQMYIEELTWRDRVPLEAHALGCAIRGYGEGAPVRCTCGKLPYLTPEVD